MTLVDMNTYDCKETSANRNLEERIVLVKEGDKRRIIFNVKYVDDLKDGTPLILKQQGKTRTLEFNRNAKIDWTWLRAMPVSLCDVRQPSFWKFDRKTECLSVSVKEENGNDYDYVLEIDQHGIEGEKGNNDNPLRFTEGTYIWMIHEKRSKDQTKREKKNGELNRNAFAIVENDTTGGVSISPSGMPGLYLGWRGGIEMRNEERLVEMIHFNESEVAKELINKMNKQQINAQISYENQSRLTTYLQEACVFGRLEIVKWLLQNHARADGPQPENLIKIWDPKYYPSWDKKETPLTEACKYGHSDIVKHLLNEGAQPNKQDSNSISPIATAARYGSEECIKSMLTNQDTDINCGSYPPIVNAIHHIGCFKLLLKYGASIDYESEDKGFPIQLACKMDLGDALPIVSTILESRGHLSVERIKILGGGNCSDAMLTLITAYANLSIFDLSRCISRAFMKYQESCEEHIDLNNPLQACMDLAEVVRYRWKLMYRSAPTTESDDLHRLYINLQLGAAAIMKEIHQDTIFIHISTGDREIVRSKKTNLEDFLGTEASKNAIKTARKIHSRVFFSQPTLCAIINETWYRNIIQDLLLDPRKWTIMFPKYICSFMSELLLQLTLLVLTAIVQTIWPIAVLVMCVMKYAWGECYGEEVPTYTGPICGLVNNYREMAFNRLAPICIFIAQCAVDLVLAIIFTMSEIDDLKTMKRLEKGCLIYVTCGICAWEIRSMITKRSVITHFSIDPFNYFDLPGISMAILSIFNPSKASLSLACILLWIRMLRLLTIHPGTGSLTLMAFRMMKEMMIWLWLLIVFVIAFGSGAAKLGLVRQDDIDTKDELCSRKHFFEDAISGGDSTFNCQEPFSDKRRFLGLEISLSDILIYVSFMFGHVLLINMLIALMGEAFDSIWHAQEANYNFQRASHYLEISETLLSEKRLGYPIHCFYSPFCLYELICFIRKKYAIRQQDANVDIVKYKLDVKCEDDFTAKVYNYICDHQDESSEDERWRFGFSRKITRIDQKVDQKVERIEKRLDAILNEQLETSLEIKRIGDYNESAYSEGTSTEIAQLAPNLEVQLHRQKSKQSSEGSQRMDTCSDMRPRTRRPTM